MKAPSPGSCRWRSWPLIWAMTLEAKALVEPFMKAIVANFGNEWEMTSADIDAALAQLKDGRASRALARRGHGEIPGDAQIQGGGSSCAEISARGRNDTSRRASAG